MTKKKSPPKTAPRARPKSDTTSLSLPPLLDGFLRVPTLPLWWEGHGGQLKGALVDVEPTEAPDGHAINALVFVVTEATKARDNWGKLHDVPARATVRISSPQLLKCAQHAQDKSAVRLAVVHHLEHEGRSVYIMDLSAETFPREDFLPGRPAAA